MMFSKVVLLLLLLVQVARTTHVSVNNEIDSGGFYTVGLVQYEPVDSSSPQQALLDNLKGMQPFIASAQQQGADIIVTPEFALFPASFALACTLNFTEFSQLCEPFPDSPTQWVSDASVNPCANPSLYPDSPLSVQASCLAANLSTTLAINACDAYQNETSGETQYFNVEVVYDATGAVIAKYWKSHPFYTSCFATPFAADIVTFNATYPSSGLVEFGIFTCKDILYPDPSNDLYNMGIRHFVYSSAIPAIGRAAMDLWSKMHSDATLLGSDLSLGESGVYLNGRSVGGSCPSSGNAVVMSKVVG
eukprot:TRINITY_DN179_c0_g1_i1.p1 TRINITY_DN179_c0_g1~~TRINITY_DN179_c0_g1_i1.p1  ORF type:complete len:305 (-),score=59.17 TRINITY_DN179_c0_g1_i1:19-933(-)